MATPFYEQPILNSPYVAPTRYHALDAEGQPLDKPPLPGRRESKLLTPVPKAKKRSGGKQASLALSAESDASGQEYNPTPIVNEIRRLVEVWRRLPNPADWGVTPVTARLLRHWRDPAFTGTRPFFCQVEAVETLIWLTEVANRRQHGTILAHIEGANAQSNPGLARQACKMATGSGKTTVMAMLIAWQALNAARSDSKRFSKGFLIVAPGITIKDRLRVLLPADSESYYAHRGLVPPDMLADLRGAKIVITNYHAFRRTETMEISKVGRALLQGDGPAPDTLQDRGRDAARRLRRAVADEERRRHQRRGAPLLPREGRRPRRGGGERRGARGGQGEQGGRAPLDLRHRGAQPQGRRARGLRSLRHAVLPARLGLSRGHAVPLGRQRLQPDGRDRERHRQAAAGAGLGQPAHRLRHADVPRSVAPSWKAAEEGRGQVRRPRSPPAADPAADGAERALRALRQGRRGMAPRRHRRAAGLHRGLQQHRDLEDRLRLDRRLRATERGRRAGLLVRGAPRAVPQLRQLPALAQAQHSARRQPRAGGGPGDGPRLPRGSGRRD